MSCDKTNCVISLGLTIIDRCSECEKQENAAMEEERIARIQAFAARWSSDYTEMGCKSGNKSPPIVQRTEEPELVTILPEQDTSFFVSCIEDSGERRKALLLGPYATHAEALANVDRGAKLACAAHAKANWYSFGTCSIANPTERKGMFGK